MVLYSFSFFVFFVAFSVFLHITTAKKQALVILLANIIFYAHWDYRLLSILFGIITVTYFCAFMYTQTHRNIWISLGVLIALSTLGLFKYFNFFVETFSKAFGINDFVTVNLILPLGISFYTFQVLSYLFDLKRGTVKFDRNYIKLAAYISFFPQITSGPIVKAHDFLPQLEKEHKIKKGNIYDGVQLFLTGLTKKVVFADRIGVAVTSVFSAPNAYSGISLLFAVIGYSLQIYCDFSGYSDMAIGIAKIWDFDLGSNFNAPYLAKNPSEFWSRWHISLSSWFKEYVYIPLGGNRHGKLRTYINLLVTMTLSGLWHGANMTYIVWGALHGLASVIHKWIFPDKSKKYPQICGMLYTLINCMFVSFTWIIFRSPTLSNAYEIIRGLFRVSGILYVNVYVICYSVIIGLAFAVSKYRNNGDMIKVHFDIDKLYGKIAIAIWIFGIISLMYVGDSAFIYAQF